MSQSENNANNALFLQENKNSIMGKQWTFYPPNRGIGTLDYPPNLNKIIIIWWANVFFKELRRPILPHHIALSQILLLCRHLTIQFNLQGFTNQCKYPDCHQINIRLLGSISFAFCTILTYSSLCFRIFALSPYSSSIDYLYMHQI